MDAECISLCEAMNRFKGIQTFESCCGHGKDVFCIWFSVESLEVLPALLYFFTRCQTCGPGHGVNSWLVRVTTDSAMSSVVFCVESTSVGDEAYVEAETIAKCMIEQPLDIYKAINV